jgi:hypothetical protein
MELGTKVPYTAVRFVRTFERLSSGRNSSCEVSNRSRCYQLELRLPRINAKVRELDAERRASNKFQLHRESPRLQHAAQSR